MTRSRIHPVRLAAAAGGVAAAVAAAVLVFGVGTAFLMFWAAPVLLLARPGDGLNFPWWRKWTLRAAAVVLVANLVVLTAATIEFVRQDGFINFVPVAVAGPMCFTVPAGLVCLPHLVALTAKRLFREPEADEEKE